MDSISLDTMPSDWDGLVEDGYDSDPRLCARMMGCDLGTALSEIKLARAGRLAAADARKRLNVYDALLVYGGAGVMRFKSRQVQARGFSLPQFAA